VSKKNKKILIINTTYRQLGGEDINIIEEVNFLQKFYKVDYLEFQNKKKLQFKDLFYFLTLNNKDSNSQLQNKINQFNPDLVYVNNTWFRGNLGLFKILKKNKIKTILKIHNFRYECTRHITSKGHVSGDDVCKMCGRSFKSISIFNKYFPDSYMKSFAILRYGFKYIKILKEYPIHIFTLNSFHKNFLINLGVKETKVRVSYNPINFDSYKFNSSKKRLDYVTYAGRISSEKGLNELLDTWVSADTENLMLKIVGDGELLESLKQKHTEENIQFLGEKTQEETLSIIKNSLAIITATKMYEGQPRLLCEASSYGIPSIFPKFGGLEEYFPSEYPLSFEQFNYEDLKKKINLLNNKRIVNVAGLKVYDYLKSIIREERLINNFEEILSYEK
jgi:glycosyltransferase involved in cell wall biosynthesis